MWLEPTPLPKCFIWFSVIVSTMPDTNLYIQHIFIQISNMDIFNNTYIQIFFFLILRWLKSYNCKIKVLQFYFFILSKAWELNNAQCVSVICAFKKFKLNIVLFIVVCLFFSCFFDSKLAFLLQYVCFCRIYRYWKLIFTIKLCIQVKCVSVKAMSL